jgi:ribose 5-phosphate isomerase B
MSQVSPLPVLIFGADHGGFSAKSELLKWAGSVGYTVVDAGARELDPNDDYPVFAKKVAQLVRSKSDTGERAYGVLICRSGAGMVMAANRFPGIRAVEVLDEEQADHARVHNDANVIAFSGDWTDLDTMKQCLQRFVTTPFSAENRHQRRIEQLDTLAA